MLENTVKLRGPYNPRKTTAFLENPGKFVKSPGNITISKGSRMFCECLFWTS